MRTILIAFCLSLLVGAKLHGQTGFDSPDVLQTSFTRKFKGENTARHSGYPPESYGLACDSCSLGTDFHESNSLDCCGATSKFYLTTSGIVDVPLDGVFHTGDDARVSAGTLGVPGAILTAATPIDLLINEQGFDDIYNTFGGFQTNLSYAISCTTDFYFGYRLTTGRANQVTIGQAVSNPGTAPDSYNINAQFSDFSESQLQMGFLSSHCMSSRIDFIWGGRIGLGFVDDITATLDIPAVVTLADLPFYDDTTTLSFGFNYGLQMNLGCHVAAHILTGVEYRSSLNQVDTSLAAIGLDELNDGSGFASLPVYMGLSYRR